MLSSWKINNNNNNSNKHSALLEALRHQITILKNVKGKNKHLVYFSSMNYISG